MPEIVSAFPVAGGIQVNREVSSGVIDCQMVFPGDAGWDEALAAAGHFDADAMAPAPTLADLRAASSLPRSDFLLRCVTVGILSQDDALLAARGEIPAAFASVVEGWTEAERFEVKLRWAALTQVERNHPLILSMATQMGITDEQLDMLFGLPTGDPE